MAVDIHSPTTSGVRWLAERAGGKPVIYVPGNYEWYSVGANCNVADESRRAANLAAKLGVHWLMDREVDIDGVRFLGLRLWTDYALYGNVAGAMRVAEHALNDHRCIFPDAAMIPLSPAQARAWHDKSRNWLTDRLATRSELPTAVVMHHLPHPIRSTRSLSASCTTWHSAPTCRD